jgi:hypothetical protein
MLIKNITLYFDHRHILRALGEVTRENPGRERSYCQYPSTHSNKIHTGSRETEHRNISACLLTTARGHLNDNSTRLQ